MDHHAFLPRNRHAAMNGFRVVLTPERPKLAPLLQALALAQSARGSRAIDFASPISKECL